MFVLGMQHMVPLTPAPGNNERPRKTRQCKARGEGRAAGRLRQRRGLALRCPGF